MTTATTLGAIFMTPFLCKTLLGTVVPVDAVGIAMSTLQVSSLFIIYYVKTISYPQSNQKTGCISSNCSRHGNQEIFP